MMPGVRGVLVAVAPFPAPIGAGQLRAAKRDCLLAECPGQLVVCHRVILSAAVWLSRGTAGLGVLAVVAAVPAAGYGRCDSLRPGVHDGRQAVGQAESAESVRDELRRQPARTGSYRERRRGQ